MTKKFSVEYLKEVLNLPEDALEERIVDHNRWSVVYEIIFQDTDGKYYKTWYSIGATEYQDERPWEYDTEVECIEVHKKLVTKYEWAEV